jgi:hypothetical protein
MEFRLPLWFTIELNSPMALNGRFRKKLSSPLNAPFLCKPLISEEK